MNSQASLQAALEEKFGLRNLRQEWIRRQAELSVDEVMGPICRVDICQITEGTLPWNIVEAHSVQLDTKVLVQIEDIVNIANSDPRSMEAPRVLQLTLTDGFTDFIAVELEPLQRLSMRTAPGTKLVLHKTALIRRGRVLFTGKDFTFLGSPASNPSSNIVWGESYREKISAALGAAGLHNPQASTFDSIAQNNGQLLVDMGGIADAVRITDEDDDDHDDDFWAQAAAVADRSEAQAAQAVNARASADEGEFVEMMGGSVVTPESRTVPIRSESQVRTTPVQMPKGRQIVQPISNRSLEMERTTQVQPFPTRQRSAPLSPEIVDIPDVPECESDPVVINSDSDFEGVALDDEVPFEIQEEEMDFEVSIPELPFSRLRDIEEATGHSLQLFVCRAYVTKPKKKPKARQFKGGLVFDIAFDDGIDVSNLAIADNFFGNLSVVVAEDAMNAAASASENSGMSNPFLDNPIAFANTIHTYSRALIGFVQVEYNGDTAIVTKVSQEPPDGFSRCIHKLADNVEARLTRYLIQ